MQEENGITDRIEAFDELNGYCRMLGHYLPFRYCRTQQDGLPCAKIIDCFFEKLPIQAFVEKHYTAQQREEIFKQRPPKMQTILELVEQVKRRSR